MNDGDVDINVHFTQATFRWRHVVAAVLRNRVLHIARLALRKWFKLLMYVISTK